MCAGITVLDTQGYCALICMNYRASLQLNLHLSLGSAQLSSPCLLLDPVSILHSRTAFHTPQDHGEPFRRTNRGFGCRLHAGLWTTHCLGGHQADACEQESAPECIHLHGMGRNHRQRCHRNPRMGLPRWYNRSDVSNNCILSQYDQTMLTTT